MIGVSYNRSLRVATYILKLIPSVCLYHRSSNETTWCFYVKCLMLYINGFVSTSSIYRWKAFFKFRIFGRKPKFLKWRARREYWSNCNVLYINGFVSTSSTKLQTNGKLFFKFQIVARKRKFVKWIARSKYWSNCNVLCINWFVSTSSTN